MKVDLSEGEARPSTLYVVATPIGNMGDITLRAIKVLGSVDVIAAEDTRVTKGLLAKLKLQGRLISYREHNEVTSSNGIIKLLSSGNSVAIVTDAGTPAICDPGAVLVSRAREAGYHVEPVPGASALTAAISVSGLSQAGFLFKGFLPAKASERKFVLTNFESSDVPVVVFESPHRIKECLFDMISIFGHDLKIFIGRELTKVHEETVLFTLHEAVNWVSSGVYQSRGEFVIVLFFSASSREDEKVPQEARELLRELMVSLSLKQAVDIVAKYAQVRRKKVYQIALEMQEELDINKIGDHKHE